MRLPFIRPRWRSFMMNESFFFHSTKDYIPSNTSILTIFCDSKTIIDDTLIFSNHIPILLHYFSCVAQVFTKYRLLFKLSKRDFFLSRVEYVGHDLTADGNCFAQPKFTLIKQWPLPPLGGSLLSFIGLCSFYNNHVPWFESNIMPFHLLQRLYHRQALPLLAWSPQLINVFENCNKNLFTSSLLIWYDSSKLTFIKTDWSTGGMGYIHTGILIYTQYRYRNFFFLSYVFFV